MGFHCPARRCIRQRLPVTTQEKKYEVGKKRTAHTHGRLTNTCSMPDQSSGDFFRWFNFYSMEGWNRSTTLSTMVHAQDKERTDWFKVVAKRTTTKMDGNIFVANNAFSRQATGVIRRVHLTRIAFEIWNLCVQVEWTIWTRLTYRPVSLARAHDEWDVSSWVEIYLAIRCDIAANRTQFIKGAAFIHFISCSALRRYN